MTRARHRNDWYYPISDDATFEVEFEALIVQNAGLLRPDAIILPFKETIFADDLAPRRADLVLIDTSYRFWWVIEVELVGHSLENHVLPQVRTFVEGRYGEPHISALLKAEPLLDSDRLRAMVRSNHPEIVVISNRHDIRWEAALKNEGVSFCVINIFRSDTNRDIFIVGEGLPHPSSECLTNIVPAKSLPGMYRVIAPGSLDLAGRKTIGMEFGGKQILFKIYETAKDWYIVPENFRMGTKSYSIFLDGNRMELREKEG